MSFALLGALLVGSVLGLGIVQASSLQAIEDSVRADLGQRQYALQTGDPAVQRTLAGVPDAAPVTDETGEVRAGALSSAAQVRSTSSPDLGLGVLAEGRRPAADGEILLTRAVAQALDIGVGAQVALMVEDRESPATVVGIAVDPAAAQGLSVFRLDSTPAPATRWLLDRDPYTITDLQQPLDRRVATYQSLDSLVELARANPPQFVTAMSRLPLAAALLIAIVIGALVGASTRRWRVDVRSLTAAGFTHRAAWRRVAAAAVSALVAGEVLGGVLVLAALDMTKQSMSGWFDQAWLHLSVPWTWVGLVVAVTVALGALAPQIVPLVPRILPWVSARQTARRGRVLLPGVVATIALLGWGALVWLSRRPDAPALVVPQAVAGVAALAALSFVVGPLVGRLAPPASRVLLASLGGPMRPVVAVAAIVVFLGGAYTANTVYEANLGQALDNPLQPAGSFVISEVPDEVLAPLEQSYADRGGQSIASYRIPDENTERVRVSSIELLTCMKDLGVSDPEALPERCWPQDTAAPVNQVMLGPPGSSPHGDPGLVSDETVGILVFSPDQGTVSRLTSTTAQPEPGLGGLLPGLVIAPDSDTATALSLRAGGKSLVVLQDFSTLSPKDRSEMRAAVLRLAPAAQTSDGTNPTAYDRLRSVAHLIGSLSAVGAGILILLGGGVVALANITARRAVVDLGALPRRRRRLVAMWTVLPVALPATAAAMAITTASLFGGRHDAAFGLMWALPGVVAVTAGLGVGILLHRPGGRAGSRSAQPTRPVGKEAPTKRQAAQVSVFEVTCMDPRSPLHKLVKRPSVGIGTRSVPTGGSLTG